MLIITSKRVGMLAATLATLAAGCSRTDRDDQKNAAEQTAAGTVDTSSNRLSTVTPAVGPAVQVTQTDQKSVQRATDYELTNENFSKFLAAADSVAALEGRDSSARKYLATNITGAASSDVDAGLKRLEANDSVSAAINSAGISVRDYFVASIATATAARFLNDPKAAPETPTLTKNARFLQSHKADLDRLQAERDHRPVVTSTP